MKKLIPVLGFILSFLFPLTLWADNITEEQALQIAQQFMASKNYSFSVSKTSAKSHSTHGKRLLCI